MFDPKRFLDFRTERVGWVIGAVPGCMPRAENSKEAKIPQPLLVGETETKN